MALTRKPTPISVLSENQIDALINKGGGIPEASTPPEALPYPIKTEKRTAVVAKSVPEKRGRKKKIVEEIKIPTQLRLSQEMLDEIDQLIEQRKLKISRHSWFLEAILFKIESEK
jgi:hypothetical protein